MAKDDTLQSVFNEIYNANADGIFRFCRSRVSDRERALDITQETFLRFWQTLSDGKTMTNSRSFLFTVAHRLIIDWYRKKKPVSLEGLYSESSSSETDAESYDPSDEMMLADHELGAEGRYLIESFQKLDPSYRQVMYLRFVEGLPPSEIAKILGVSPNAVSVRLNRGAERLRAITGYDVTT